MKNNTEKCLLSIRRHGRVTLKTIASNTRLSVSQVKGACQRLRKEGLADSDGKGTWFVPEKKEDFITPHRLSFKQFNTI